MQPFSNPNTALIILGIVAIIVEVALGAVLGFELLVLGVIFVIGGIVGTITGSIVYAIILIAVLIIGYTLVGRGFIQKSLHITTHKTNVDAMIGKTGQVVVRITPQEPGQVKFEGEVWRAESEEELAEGQKVTIQSVSGVTIKVVPLK